MAKKVVAQQSKQNTTNWWVLGIALLALVISLFAWDNSKKSQYKDYQNLQTEIKDLQQQMQLEQARQKLEQLRVDVEQNKNLEQVQEEIATAREELRQNFQDADAKAQAYWQEIDAEIEQLQASLKDKGLDALKLFDNLIQKLKLRPAY